MIKSTFYIPESFNDGNQIPTEIIEGLKSVVISTFGGLTIKGKAQGFWQNSDGEIMKDNNLIFEVAHNADDIKELEEILIEYKELLKQQKLYLEIDGEITFI